jgi:hypothetical protein
MAPPTIDTNPYQSPAAQESPTPAAVCSFCGKSPAGGAIVQSPGREVYICGSCARIAARQIERHNVNSLPMACLWFTLAASLLVLVPVNWFVLDDGADVGWTVSLVGLAIGVVCLGHYCAAVYARIRRSVRASRNTVPDSTTVVDSAHVAKP